ncbi:hypothetical protein E7V67_006305 [[Empedobacter] haloabium]|uniref:Uncharacterized protein n=1 Tax=[Empedobacter] haloabium TaxID=592317 RepID=A0ABZ1URE2_9BURK
MRAVFFPEELNDRAPNVIGHFCADPGHEWLTLLDIVDAIRRGEEVTIRPATDSELKRADAYISLYEIGTMLGEKLVTLLDREDPGVADAKLAAFAEMVTTSDINSSMSPLLDVAEG